MNFLRGAGLHVWVVPVAAGRFHSSPREPVLALEATQLRRKEGAACPCKGSELAVQGALQNRFEQIALELEPHRGASKGFHHVFSHSTSPRCALSVLGRWTSSRSCGFRDN